MTEHDMETDPALRMRQHRFLEQDLDDGSKVFAIAFDDPPLAGFKFAYDRVTFNVINDVPRLSFDYIIFEHPYDEIDHDEMKQILGDFLLGLISIQMKNGSLIYGGGVDSAGTDNFISINDQRSISS